MKWIGKCVEFNTRATRNLITARHLWNPGSSSFPGDLVGPDTCMVNDFTWAMLADMGTWRPPAYTLHDLCNNSLSERCGGSCSLATGGAATYFSGQISSNYLPNKLADVPYVIVLPTMGTLPPQPLSLSSTTPWCSFLRPPDLWFAQMSSGGSLLSALISRN